MKPNEAPFKMACRPSRRVWLTLAAALVLLAGPSLATELVYRPINPNFGGNPFNDGILARHRQRTEQIPRRRELAGIAAGS